MSRLVYNSSKLKLKSILKIMLCGHVPHLALICVSIFIFQTGEEEGMVSKAVAPSLDYIDFK